MIYQRVLVPVSGKNSGERAAKALRHAKTLCSGEIILLHVTEALPNLVGGAAMWTVPKGSSGWPMP